MVVVIVMLMPLQRYAWLYAMLTRYKNCTLLTLPVVSINGPSGLRHALLIRAPHTTFGSFYVGPYEEQFKKYYRA